MGGGTEAFPDLGSHCQKSDCHQLDFLPFTCNGCRKVFCLEHRSGKSHECPKPDAGRKVVVCETCSAAIETTGCDGEEEKKILAKHEKSGDCDPTKKKKKLICPVRRCKEVLTFSNTATCKTCRVKICLKHRFPADHACHQLRSSPSATASASASASAAANKFLAALSARSGKDCGNKTSISSSQPSVKAC